MRTLRYLFTYAINHRERVYQLDFIGEFLQAKFKDRVFMKLDIRYADYFTEYSSFF